jgi:hypothetical protein
VNWWVEYGSLCSRRGKGIRTQGYIGVVGMSNAAKSLWEQELSQGAFMVVHEAPSEEQGDVGKLSAMRREEEDGIYDEGDSRVRRE